MSHNNAQGFANLNEEGQTEIATVEQQLADAQKEINELKMQIQWMERSYE